MHNDRTREKINPQNTRALVYSNLLSSAVCVLLYIVSVLSSLYIWCVYNRIWWWFEAVELLFPKSWFSSSHALHQLFFCPRVYAWLRVTIFQLTVVFWIFKWTCYYVAQICHSDADSSHMYAMLYWQSSSWEGTFRNHLRSLSQWCLLFFQRHQVCYLQVALSSLQSWNWHWFSADRSWKRWCWLPCCRYNDCSIS